MNLEDVILSERSQTQKDKHCVIPLTGGPWRSQIHRDRKEMVGARGWESGWELVFNGGRASVWEGEKVPETDGGDGGTTVRMC